MAKLAFRIQQGDTCGEWSKIIEKESKKDKNLYPISYALARAISGGEVDVEIVRGMIYRGGDPETLLAKKEATVEQEAPVKEEALVEKKTKRGKKVVKEEDVDPVNPFDVCVLDA